MRANPKSIALRGMIDSAPFLLVVVPFGFLFGVVAAEAGLDLVETMAMTILVIAGAAQFTALQQMIADAPVFMVIITALAVNLRMAMYSASLTPWIGKAPLWQRALAAYMMVDQAYLLSHMKYEAEPELRVAERVRYYFGTLILIAPLWYAAGLAGALVGKTVPDAWALDFAMPITFLAMLAPMVRTLAHLAAAMTSVVVALLLSGLPFGSGLLVAAGAAMAVGAGVEVLMERRQ
ncbi:MAG: branched-chain amino acid ABC transporter permease [Alphaproteobacteria bacterium]|nr:MAG: branched-chain amino acid ABC transporter permease [Alphaproteobacteria bacterium]